MASFHVVLSKPGERVVQVGYLVLNPDGTGTLTMRLPMKGELAVTPAANEDDEVTVPGAGQQSPLQTQSTT